MCGLLFTKGDEMKRMYKDSTPVGQTLRNADRRNAEKDKNRVNEENLTIEKDKREAYGRDRKRGDRTRKSYDNSNTGLNIYK